MAPVVDRLTGWPVEEIQQRNASLTGVAVGRHPLQVLPKAAFRTGLQRPLPCVMHTVWNPLPSAWAKSSDLLLLSNC